MLQHDALSWQVEGSHFCSAVSLNAKSRKYDEIFGRWIESADMEQRKSFTADFFNALEAGGATSMMEVAHGGADGFESILYAMAKSKKESKMVAGKLLWSFWEEMKQIDYRRLFGRKKMLQGIAAFAIGAGNAGLYICGGNLSDNQRNDNYRKDHF